MPQSLAQAYLHIVFRTKDRLPYFDTADLRNRLSAYIVGALDHQGSPSLATNSVEDHLHCL